MTADQWQQVKNLFGECMDLPRDLRDRYLEAGGLSEEVRGEVVRLFQNLEEASEGFLDSPILTSLRKANLVEAGEIVAGRFDITRFLGRGGMGEVYAAHDREIGEDVALKILFPTGVGDGSGGFRRELQFARRVTHANVCRVFDLGRHQFEWGIAEFLSMELLSGETLAETLSRHGPFTAKESFIYLDQILAGLQAAHDAGVIHRDLKPGNVMTLPATSGTPRVVLMDFGLARLGAGLAGNPTQTQSREIRGTLAYMAPEQLAGGPVSPRTDLYAFGVILFEMLHGVRPFERSDEVRTGDEAATQGERRQQIPPPWLRVIDRCLNPDPSKRPVSAREIAKTLESGIKRHSWDIRRLSRRTLLFTGAAAISGAAVSYVSLSHAKPQFAAGSSLLVANPEQTYGGAVSLQIRAALRQSARIAVWDDAKAQDAWARMNRGTAEPAARDWREIALRDGVHYVLFPSLAQVGDGTSLTFRLEHLEGTPDKPLQYWQQSFEGADQQHVLEAIDAGSRWIRKLIGESQGDIATSSASPQAVTTPSWEALKEFSRGESLMSHHDREGAVLAFTSATRLDPLFTMAWMRIGDVQTSLGRENEAFGAWQRAVEAAKNRPLTRREDLRFRGMLASDSGVYGAAEGFFHEYTFYFPDEWYGSFYRALPLLLMGRPQESIAELERCLNFPAVRMQSLVQLNLHYSYKGDQNAASGAAAKLRQLGSEARAAFSDAVIAYIGGDTEAALHALNRAAADDALLPRSKATLSQAIVLADGGRTGDALQMLRTGAEEDAKQGQRERWAAKLIGVAALLESEGDQAGALKAVRELGRVQIGPTHTGWAGMFLARLGDLAQAEHFLDTIPADIHFPRFQIPRLKVDAALRFARGQTDEAMRLTKQAAALEPTGFGCYYLAEALERAGRKAEAVAEYREYLRSKPFQLHLATPAPAGSWYRAAAAVRRLELH